MEEYPLTIFKVSIESYDTAGSEYTLTFEDGSTVKVGDGDDDYWTLADIIDRQAEMAYQAVNKDWWVDGHYISAGSAKEAAQTAEELYRYNPSIVRPWDHDKDEEVWS